MEKKTVPFAHLFLVRRLSLSLCSKRFRQIEGYGAISTKPATPLLDTVNVPAHLKSMDMDQLKQVAKELRADLIYNVSQTGGHLGSSLGVIELTVALNYVFDQPEDRII